MKLNQLIKWILVGLTGIAFFTIGHAGMAEDQGMGIQYGMYIDSCIERCEKEASVQKSGIYNIRDDTSINLLKANFCKKNRRLLIEDMLKEGVSVKSYKMQRFVNERFFAILRDNTLEIVNGYSLPDHLLTQGFLAGKNPLRLTP